VRLSRYIFSATFALSISMLILFLQEVWQTFDTSTAAALWKVTFVATTFMLLVIIPGALMRDFFFA
jgi:hypothetical protein